MPKAILAMRTYPATIALAILLFLLTLIITTGSLGKVRSGGDGGDGGSGMGGTGKSGEFGGSGFGGTGGPSPFFTVTDPAERKDSTTVPAIPEAVGIPVELIAQDPEVQAAEGNPRHQDPLLEAIERHPLVEETRQEIAQEAPAIAEPVEQPAIMQESIQIVEATVEPRPEPTTAPALLPETVPASPVPESGVQLATTPETQEPVLESRQNPPEEVQQLAETMTVKLETDPEGVEPERERPDRIQRPDLPPFQRITPIERPALLPPRVQPMRI